MVVQCEICKMNHLLLTWEPWAWVMTSSTLDLGAVSLGNDLGYSRVL